MAASPVVGRPKIPGLVQINLRLVEADLAALDAIVETERVARRDPALNRSDLIREALSEYLSRHPRKRTRA